MLLLTLCIFVLIMYGLMKIGLINHACIYSLFGRIFRYIKIKIYTWPKKYRLLYFMVETKTSAFDVFNGTHEDSIDIHDEVYDIDISLPAIYSSMHGKYDETTKMRERIWILDTRQYNIFVMYLHGKGIIENYILANEDNANICVMLPYPMYNTSIDITKSIISFFESILAYNKYNGMSVLAVKILDQLNKNISENGK